MENQNQPESKLLRVFIGENDKLKHRPLYEALLYAAKEQELSGATVLRGIMSFGASSRVHSAKLIEISQDLPIVVEIVDEEDKINGFLKTVKSFMEEAGCGGLITVEKMQVLYYGSGKNKGNEKG